jgi:hypothetical protein
MWGQRLKNSQICAICSANGYKLVKKIKSTALSDGLRILHQQIDPKINCETDICVVKEAIPLLVVGIIVCPPDMSNDINPSR